MPGTGSSPASLTWTRLSAAMESQTPYAAGEVLVTCSEASTRPSASPDTLCESVQFRAIEKALSLENALNNYLVGLHLFKILTVRKV